MESTPILGKINLTWLDLSWPVHYKHKHALSRLVCSDNVQEQEGCAWSPWLWFLPVDGGRPLTWRTLPAPVLSAGRLPECTALCVRARPAAAIRARCVYFCVCVACVYMMDLEKYCLFIAMFLLLFIIKDAWETKQNSKNRETKGSCMLGSHYCHTCFQPSHFTAKYSGLRHFEAAASPEYWECLLFLLPIEAPPVVFLRGAIDYFSPELRVWQLHSLYPWKSWPLHVFTLVSHLQIGFVCFDRVWSGSHLTLHPWPLRLGLCFHLFYFHFSVDCTGILSVIHYNHKARTYFL